MTPEWAKSFLIFSIGILLSDHSENHIFVIVNSTNRVGRESQSRGNSLHLHYLIFYYMKYSKGKSLKVMMIKPVGLRYNRHKMLLLLQHSNL